MHACHSVSVLAIMAEKAPPGLPEDLTAPSGLNRLCPHPQRKPHADQRGKSRATDHARKTDEREHDATASDADRSAEKARCVDQARALAGLGRRMPDIANSLTDVEQRVRESLRLSTKRALRPWDHYGERRPLLFAVGQDHTRRPEALSSERHEALRLAFSVRSDDIGKVLEKLYIFALAVPPIDGIGAGPLAVGPARTRTPSLNTARSRTPLPSPRGNSKSVYQRGLVAEDAVNRARQRRRASVVKGRTAKARTHSVQS